MFQRKRIVFSIIAQELKDETSILKTLWRRLSGIESGQPFGVISQNNL